MADSASNSPTARDVVDIEDTRADNPLLDQLDRELPPGRAAEQIDAILRRDDAPSYFRSLEPTTFYRLMKRAGWDQSYDLVQYASPEQVQVFVDLDCWNQDRLMEKDFEKWLASLVSESNDDHFQEVLRDLDPEIMAIFFKKNLEVEHTNEEQKPPRGFDAGDREVATTPDGQYAVKYPDDEETTSLIRMAIDRMYHTDRVLAWTLLEAVRWEMVSEMEERAYSWRNKRLLQFGFVPREEALEIYAYRDPVSYREDVRSRDIEPTADVNPPTAFEVPAVLREEFDAEFFLFDVMESLTDREQLKKLTFELRSLLNRAMVADGIDPGEIETGRQVVRRTLGYLSLGLEFLSHDDLDTARRDVVDLPLKRIFQTGYSLTRKIQKKLEELRDRPTLSLIEGDRYSLLDEDERALAESLERQRPTFAADAATFDVFKEQSQVDSASFGVGMIAFKQLWLFGVQGESVADVAESLFGEDTATSPEAATFNTLFATYLGRRLLDETPSLNPLDTEMLARLPDAIREFRPDDGDWSDTATGTLNDVVESIVEETPVEARKLAIRWMTDTLETLDEELGDVRQIDKPDFFAEVVLVENSAAEQT